jgi:hypothetical protein
MQPRRVMTSTMSRDVDESEEFQKALRPHSGTDDRQAPEQDQSPPITGTTANRVQDDKTGMSGNEPTPDRALTLGSRLRQKQRWPGQGHPWPGHEVGDYLLSR